MKEGKGRTLYCIILEDRKNCIYIHTTRLLPIIDRHASFLEWRNGRLHIRHDSEDVPVVDEGTVAMFTFHSITLHHTIPYRTVRTDCDSGTCKTPQGGNLGKVPYYHHQLKPSSSLAHHFIKPPSNTDTLHYITYVEYSHSHPHFPFRRSTRARAQGILIKCDTIRYDRI